MRDPIHYQIFAQLLLDTVSIFGSFVTTRGNTSVAKSNPCLVLNLWFIIARQP